jgi:hypothetical protein
VDADCSGNLLFDNGPSFYIYVSPQGGKVWMIQADSNNVFEGTVESVSRTDQACDNATLKGAYGLQISGTRAAPLPGTTGLVGPNEMVVGVVIQIFDGNGNFTQTDNVKGSFAGIVPDRPGKGTYTVNPDCTLTQVVSPPGQAPITTKGVIVDGGKELRSITVSPDSTMVTVIGRKM